MVARSLVGDALVAAQDYPAADQAYRQTLEIAQSLSKDDPRSLQKLADAYILIRKIADVGQRRERFSDAAEWYKRREKVRESAEKGFITPGRRAEFDSAKQRTRPPVAMPARPLTNRHGS